VGIGKLKILPVKQQQEKTIGGDVYAWQIM
jgi:hypothetical protein